MTLSLGRLRRSLPAAGLGLVLVATLSAASPGSTALASADPECQPSGHSAARVGHGHDGVDPNSLSATQAAALEAQFDRRVDRMAANGRLDADRTRSGATIRVRTYVHVITKKDGTGAVSREQLKRQMAVINAGYAGRTSPAAAPSPFRFVVAGVDVTRNNAWYDWTLNDDGSEPAAMKQAKRALHRGGFATLNIYIAGLGSGLLGYATYPGGPLKLDGLVILNESMPGGDAAPYNGGDTATHEIGHWLYLYHTFENGCKAPGDRVKDTPYQDDGENIFYCGDFPGTEEDPLAVPNDTCPQPGKDPVHNFMSYGDDACLNQFTEGQNKRQVLAWKVFRASR